jgi:hypothetical protein
MGYTSDIQHCYLILATREPYKLGGFWTKGASYDNVTYRVVRSGNRNRLGETIQTYSTTDAGNVYPQLRNNLTNLINLSAQTYDHNLTQRFGPNVASDSLNPFVTGKAGIYRPETQVLNLRDRNYTGGTARNAGVFPSMAYWQTEQDRFASYCPDTSICTDCPDTYYGVCKNPLQWLSIKHLGADSFRFDVLPTASDACAAPSVLIAGIGIDTPPPGWTLADLKNKFSYYDNSQFSFKYRWPYFGPGNTSARIFYSNGCCNLVLKIEVNTDSNKIYFESASSTRADGSKLTAVDTFFNDSGSIPPPRPATYLPFRIRKKIVLGKVGHYDGADRENWVKTQEITRYNGTGQELENKEEGLGYNSAIYGYNQQLPVCVAKNARHNEVLFDGFEDYALLQQKPDLNPSYLRLQYSPFAAYLTATNPIGTAPFATPYSVGTLSSSTGTYTISTDDAHTGYYALKVPTGVTAMVPINATDALYAKNYSFNMSGARKYVAAIWLKPLSIGSGIIAGYSGSVSLQLNGGGSTLTSTLVAKTNIIEGWQLYEATFDMPAGYNSATLVLGGGYYYDDLRIYPFSANSKGFVYDPVTRKLMATLDENNYATFYEYDPEGNLVRTKKETEKGILTITESRSTHRKSN